MTDVRITHTVTEVLRDGDPSGRLTHVVTEVLRDHPTLVQVSKVVGYSVLTIPDGAVVSKAVGFAVLEATTTSVSSTSSTTTTSPPVYGRITHAISEVLRSGVPDARITHAVAEVLSDYWTTTTSSTTASTTSTQSSSSTTATYPWCGWNDTFPGNNGDPANPNKWTYSGSTTVADFQIYNNKLRATTGRLGNGVYQLRMNDSVPMLSGDFDVRIDFDLTNYPLEVSSWYVGLCIQIPAGAGVSFWRYWYITDGYRINYKGSPSNYNTYADSSGKLRIVRRGITLSFWRWTGTVWDQIVSHNDWYSDDCYIYLDAQNYHSNPAIVCDFDNLEILGGCLGEPSTTTTTTITGSTTSMSSTSSTASSTSTFSTTSSSSSTASSTSTMSSTSTFSTTSSTSSTASSSSTSSTASSSSTTTTPPPEYWHTDFREMAVDVSPGGWTEEWHPTSGVSTIRDDGQIGNNCLEIVCTDERYGLSWDDVGQQDDAEILVKVRARAGVDVVGYAILRGGGTGDGTEQAYYSCLYANSNRVYIRKYVEGSSLTIAYANMTIDVDTWYWMRFRILGDDLKLRVWEDGDAEPGTWTIEVSDTDITGTGWVGLGTFYNGPDYDYVSVASNGGTALLPSLTTTTSSSSTTTSTTHTYTGSTTTMSSTSSTSSTASSTSSSSSTMSTTSTASTTSSSSSTTTTTFPPCFWNDDFTQDDGVPSRLKWTDDSVGIGYITVVDNELHIINGGGGTNTGTATCNATFSGDFVIQVDLEAVLAPFENSWSARLQALIDSSNYIWIDMHFEEATDSWTVGYRKAAPEKYPDTDARTNDYGSLRIIRTGSIFYTYYKDCDGSWTELNAGGQNIGTGDVTVSFECVSWEFAANFETAWDNFVVGYWGCPESVTTTTSSTTSSSTTTVTQSTTSSTASTTSSTASTTSTSSTTASTTSTFSTTSSTMTTVSSSSTTFSFTTTTWSGTTTTLPPPPDTQTTTMVVVTTG